MTQKTGYSPDSARLNHERLMRQLYAFLVTACASFVLMGLIWPLTLKGFRSHTRMQVRVGETAGAQQEFQFLLASALRYQTEDEQLRGLIEQVSSQSTIENPTLEGVNFETIRDAISVRAMPGPTMDTMNVDFAFRGNGTAEEQALIGLLTDAISNTLVSVARGSDVESALSIETLAASRRRQQFEKLDKMLSEIEVDLDSVRVSADRIVHEMVGQPESTSTNGPFRSVSHSNSNSVKPSNVSRSQVNLSEIQQTLSAIDLASIRQQLNHLQANWNTTSERQHFASAPRAKVSPIGGQPDNGQLMLLTVFSIVIGSVVAINFGPFATSGFRNVRRVASALKIPVVTTIPATDFGSLESTNGVRNGVRRRSVPLANRVVTVAKWVLSGFVLTVVGFCFGNEQVRTAFRENLFFGFSRIVWLLMGH